MRKMQFKWAAAAVVWPLVLFLRANAGVSSSELNAPTTGQVRVSDWVANWLRLASAVPPPSSVVIKHSITIEGDNFMLDGQNLHIISGSLHYFRLPSEYWRDRLRKLKAAGLNSVSTYVEWSYHEPEERQYQFSGDRDVAHFVQLAAEEGLHVLLRPGPYICAERDLGGLPYWLLGKYPRIQLRSKDPDFLNETQIWMDKLFEQIRPLLFGNGGPIILVQVENEYGSYGSDTTYKEALRDIIQEHVNTDAILYTTDGTTAPMISGGAISGTLTTIDFGPQSQPDITNTFAALRRHMPHGPLMNSEFYPGWLTLWGRSFVNPQQTEAIIATLREMLDRKININFYVFFGGTNFEYTSGAASDVGYTPDTTSYDYNAPLNEAGDPTPNYYAIRDVLKQYNKEVNNIPEPQPSSKGAYGIVGLTPKFGLLSSKGIRILGKKYDDIKGATLPTFESLRQRSGMILYETRVNTSGVLHISKPRDWVYVYVDGELNGVINRMYNKFNLPVKPNLNARLSLLVENQGRINYGATLHDFKGILGKVKMGGVTLKGTWSVTGFPLEDIAPFPEDTDNDLDQNESNDGPVVLDGTIKLPPGVEPKDTFIDTTGWGKGYIWVNGHHLGRYWLMPGPQATLFVPGVWLNPGPAENYIQVVEFEKIPEKIVMEFIDHPILNHTQARWRYD